MCFDMKKILLATVIYQTPYLETFLKDIVTSIKNQTQQNFLTMFFLDKIPKSHTQKIVHQFLPKSKTIFVHNTRDLNPSNIRQEIINYAYENDFDILFFLDFDEILFPTKVEETILYFQQDVDFCFCNTLLTDHLLNPINGKGFFDDKDIPKRIQNIDSILSKNFIGLGDLTIRLSKKSIYKLKVETLAYDWFLATHMLLDHWSGIKIDKCLGTYRQYNYNYIGGLFTLSPKNLLLGISVKKEHYKYFSHYDPLFSIMYKEILEVEKYIQKNMEKYIKIINQNFNTQTMCWWENIKTLEEIKQWI